MAEAISPFNDEHFMRRAFQLAQEAEEIGEIPVGAVVVAGNQVIGRGYNQTEVLRDSTAHAEMIALTSAFEYFGAKYLPDCRMYVTLEPCTMCAGAIAWSQITEVIYGADDPKKGHRKYVDSKGHSIIPSKVAVRSGVMKKECSEIIENFFRRIRDKES